MVPFTFICVVLFLTYVTYHIFKSNVSEPITTKTAEPPAEKVIKYSVKHLREEEEGLRSMSKEQLEELHSLHNKEFVNKNCTRLEDFIINEKINRYDIRKLAELNGIQVEFLGGWNYLVIALMQELDAQGWDRKVSSMKEKWGGLRFYVHNKFNEIEHKYRKMSLKVCETCGAPGKLITHGWHYVACREHYSENRGRVDLTVNGFNYSGDMFDWNEIKKMYFKEITEAGGLILLYFVLKNHIKFIGDLPEFRLREIGFGSFVRNIPSSIPGLDRDYILKNYPDPVFCEICGYKAVYNDKCECCEKMTWLSMDRGSYWQERGKELFLAERQMEWEIENGDFYEKQHTTYLKNPEHKIHFTQEQLERFREEEDDDD